MIQGGDFAYALPADNAFQLWERRALSGQIAKGETLHLRIGMLANRETLYLPDRQKRNTLSEAD